MSRDTFENLNSYWMPFTSNRSFKKDPRIVEKAEGVYYKLNNGTKVLDGISGLFCTPLGHGRPEIIEAIASELSILDYCPSFQISHPLAFKLANRLAQKTPEGLNHIFFANSGSEAVESAMKLALAYYQARGEKDRQRFVSRDRAYHGVNFGGTSLSGLKNNRAPFGQLLPGVVHMNHTWNAEDVFVQGQPEKGAELAEDLERFASLLGGHTIAACVVEPVAGSTGVLLPPKGYLERLRQICDEHGILLIFDEVITGLGRIGTPFAADYFGVKPDIITMAKALTNGMQPMGAVACDEHIYQTLMDAAPDGDGSIEFFHGYTFSAHPGACAAALSALDIVDRDNLYERVSELAPCFSEAMHSLKQSCPVLKDIRVIGLLAGMDLAPTARGGERGYKAFRELIDAGLLTKATGDSLLFAPSFVSTQNHLDEMIEKIKKVLSQY